MRVADRQRRLEGAAHHLDRLAVGRDEDVDAEPLGNGRRAPVPIVPRNEDRQRPEQHRDHVRDIVHAGQEQRLVVDDGRAPAEVDHGAQEIEDGRHPPRPEPREESFVDAGALGQDKPLKWVRRNLAVVVTKRQGERRGQGATDWPSVGAAVRPAVLPGAHTIQARPRFAPMRSMQTAGRAAWRVRPGI